MCFHNNFGKFQWISNFCQECYFRKIYEWKQQFLQRSVDLQRVKVHGPFRSLDFQTSPWTFAKTNTPIHISQQCTTIVHWLKLDIKFFCVFHQNYQIGQQSSRIPFWVTGQGCMCLTLNAQPEVQILNGLYFNICLPFPSFDSFGSAYTVVPRIASKANVLNAKKEKES